MTPEAELLTLVSRTDLSGREERLLSLVASARDWDYLWRFADWHGVVPLFYHHIHNRCPDLVPESFLARLTEEYRTNSRRAFVQVGELRGLLQLLSEACIPAIAFKGPAAAAQFYDAPGLRVSSDIDVVIARNHAAESRRILLAHGYRPAFEMSDERDARYRTRAAGYAFTSPHHGTIVDLQWDVSPSRFSFRLPLAEFESRAVPILLGEFEARTYAPRDLLLLLSIHGGKHVWECLKWLIDVAELLRRNTDMDIEEILIDAERARCRRAVLLALLLAARLLDAPVNRSMIRRAEQDRGVRWMAERVTDRLFKSAPSREGKYRIEMRLEDSALGQARFVAKRMLTPMDDDAGRGGAGLVRRFRTPISIFAFLARRTLKRPADRSR